MFGIDMYTIMTAAYLQYCVLCFICTELKQINYKIYSVTDQQSCPGLAGTLHSLSFFPLSLSARAPSQLWVCPASQHLTSGMHWTRERGERVGVGAEGQLEPIRAQEIRKSVLCVRDLTCPEP